MEQYELFLNSIRSEYTKKLYTKTFQKYQKYVGTNDIFYQNNPRLIEHKVIDFIVGLKKKGLAYSAIKNYVKPILAFYKINDIVLNTDKISRFLPEYKKLKKDRAYTYEEIQKLLDFADERLRAVIYILSSIGIRIGALSDLKLSNIDKNKFTIYEGTNEEYITFCTPECSKSINTYLEMRKRYGEKITSNSYLIREQFDVRNPGKPKRVKPETLQRKIYDLSIRCGIKDKNLPICHGFRKFFTTQLINSKVNPEIREMLLGHKIGLASVYYKPTEQEMFTEYQKAINNLTINEENRLKEKIKVLEIDQSKVDKMQNDILDMKKMLGLS